MNNLQVITHNNERVLTTSRLAEQYETTEKAIKQNFNNNKERYIEGKHYYCLTGAILRVFKNKVENFDFAANLNKLYLWAEKGTLLHAKSLNTDKAWQVYEFLVDNYFNPKQMNHSISISDKLAELKILAAADRAAAMKMNAENRRLKLLLDQPHLKDLSPIAQ